jgi:RNA polymerase sigma factor (sigma-70 family)
MNDALATPTVFVVDDDAAVRESLKTLMQSVKLNVQTFSCGQDFLDDYSPQQPGCVVLDVRMPGMSGLELQEQLQRRNIHIPAIIITGHGDVPVAVSAMKSGAMDFLQKPFSQQMLLERVQEALARDAEQREESVRQEDIRSRIDSLTPQEQRVMDLVVAGKSNKQVALQLGISKKTVETHRAHVMKKMKVDSLAELVTTAIAQK